ncbi:hypothetical protein MPSEU_000550500 [Mayamaea pseudoterrestris]|nr:hypothetical protein MPSEU_000550500 [Mayamaea pseudoterrestris]
MPNKCSQRHYRIWRLLLVVATISTKRRAATAFSTAFQSNPHAPCRNHWRHSFALHATERTLYEILGANGSETKRELKLLYTTLAKQHHPDALRKNATSDNDNNMTATTNTTIPFSSTDFSEIAAAYKTLADPKQRIKYDRSLQAARFSRNVVSWADRLGRKAAPAMTQVLDQVAVPFLRRTTATTLAGLQAVSQEYYANNNNMQKLSNNATTLSSGNTTNDANATFTSSGGSTDLRQTFEKAMAAAKRAGKCVDSMELTEKSAELYLRANETLAQARAVHEKRRQLAERRIQLAIHVPQSGLTAEDALYCLSEFNVTRLDELTMMDRLLLRNTVKDEIESLKKAENEYVESQQADSVAQAAYQKTLQQQVTLQMELKRAKVAEANARLALERALAQVAVTKASLNKVADALCFAKTELETTSSRMERRSHFLATQSERVRRHLVRKEKTEVRGAADILSDVSNHMDHDDSDKYLQEIERLRNEERTLAAEYEQLEATAARYTSRANVLTQRAQEWKQA